MITKPTIYTSQKVLGELETMLADVREDRELVYIGQLFENKPYDRSFFIDLVTQKYQGNKAIGKIYNTIKGIFESRAITGAMKGKLNPASTIFHLKNNYNWTDRQDFQFTPPAQSMELLSDDQKLKIIDRAKKTLFAKTVKYPSTVKLLTEPQNVDSK